VFHDIYLNNEMSNELLSALYASLKPGGNLIILDNAAKPDSGPAGSGKLKRKCIICHQVYRTG
jgi:predicted methyltransferase